MAEKTVVKAATTKTTRSRRTLAKKAAASKTVETEAIAFENVKQIAEYYHLTGKNVRRLLRQHFPRNSEMKNAIYKFDKAEAEAIKTFFDERYKSETETK